MRLSGQKDIKIVTVDTCSRKVIHMCSNVIGNKPFALSFIKIFSISSSAHYNMGDEDVLGQHSMILYEYDLALNQRHLMKLHVTYIGENFIKTQVLNCTTSIPILSILHFQLEIQHFLSVLDVAIAYMAKIPNDT